MTQANTFIAVHCETLPWVEAVLPNGEPKGIQFQRILQGGDGLPQVHRSRYDPHWIEARHRHLEDEVLLLTQGELEVDGVTHRAPTAIFVSRGTLYGPLTAGPEGVEFFRVGYNQNLPQQQQDATKA